MATDVKLPQCLLSLARTPGLPQTICSFSEWFLFCA